MNDKTRNKFVSYGLEILKWAVLYVLYEAEPGHVRQDVIRQHLGIPRIEYKGMADNSLIYSILALLQADGLVYHDVDQRAWYITKKGMEVIEGDL